MVQKDVELDKLDHDIHSLRVKSSRLSTLIQKKTEALYTVSCKPGISVPANTVAYEGKGGGKAGLTTGVKGGATTGLKRGSKTLVTAASTAVFTSLQRNSSRIKVTSITGSDLGPRSGIDSASNKEKEKIKRSEKDFTFK